MDEERIEKLLIEQGVGVLSMAHDDEPYGIPIAFGYDGGNYLYLLFVGHSEEGRKVTYAERSETASFLVYDLDDDGTWRSVIVEGTLDRVTIDEWERAKEAMGDNAYRPDLLTDVDEREDPRVWAVEIEEWDGRTNEGV